MDAYLVNERGMHPFFLYKIVCGKIRMAMVAEVGEKRQLIRIGRKFSYFLTTFGKFK